MVRAATSSGTPKASSTRLFFKVPEEHALPAETAKPIASRRISRACALIVGWATARMYDFVSAHARNPDPMLLSEMNDLGRQYDVTIPFRKRLF